VEIVSGKSEEKELPLEADDVTPVLWTDVTYALDFYMFWTFFGFTVMTIGIIIGLYLPK
jgi:hypothetical protein